MKTIYTTIISILIASISFAQNTSTYQYNPEGWLIQSSDGINTRVYTFDKVGNRETYSISSVLHLPNYVIQNQVVNPVTLVAGSSVDLSCRVKNTGTVAASANTHIEYFLSEDNQYSGSDVLLGSDVVTPLGENQFIDFTKTLAIPINTNSGIFYVLYIVDREFAVAESNEDDNIVYEQIEITTPTYSITASANPSSGGSVSGAGTYDYGQTCTLVASPSSGYNFENWTEGGTEISTNLSFSFVVNTNRNLIANFTTSQISFARNLNQGWTWFSVPVEQSNMEINTVLQSLSPSPNDFIKEQYGTQAQYYDSYGWLGNMTEINNTSLYQILLTNSDELQFTGTPVNTSNECISINAGWTWIAYQRTTDMDINTALTSLSCDNNDLIKSQGGDIAYYYNGSWVGTLNQLQVGEGYKIRKLNSGLLCYPASSKSIENNIIECKSNMPYFTMFPDFNPAQYQNSSSIAAKIQKDDVFVGGEDKMLIAYINGEVRGICKGVESPDGFENEFFYPMSVFINEDDAVVNFKYLDEEGKLLGIQESIEIKADSIVGNLSNQIVLNIDAMTDVKDNLFSQLSVTLSPNPAQEELKVSIYLPSNQKISFDILNASNQQFGTQKEVSLERGLNTFKIPLQKYSKGVYFIRIKGKNSIVFSKFIKI